MAEAVARMEAVPGWLVAVVAEGVQRLLVLRLDGCPPADAVQAVALAWADALWLRARGWTAEDAPRVRQAFRGLAAHAVRWPAPADLWQHLPSRAAPPQLPRPRPDPAQRAKIEARMLEIARMLGVEGSRGGVAASADGGG